MKDKNFDCVKMMHQSGQKIQEEIAGMAPEQEMEYWRHRTLILRDMQRQMRGRQETIASLQKE